MSQHPSNSHHGFEPDPIFETGLREGRWILLMWTVCFAWTMTASLTLGYPDSVDPKSFSTVMGFPAWIVWGIGLPWLLASTATIWFALTQMQDADLEDPSVVEDAFDGKQVTESVGDAGSSNHE